MFGSVFAQGQRGIGMKIWSGLACAGTFEFRFGTGASEYLHRVEVATSSCPTKNIANGMFYGIESDLVFQDRFYTETFRFLFVGFTSEQAALIHRHEVPGICVGRAYFR